jgi:hypothetical protein
MRHRLRTLLLPRRIARLHFTLYELAGLVVIAAISLAIGASFLHDSLAVSLGIIGASIFNGIACYIIGVGFGRQGARRLDSNDRPVFRFTIRDMLWLTVVVAVLVAWRVGHSNWQRERAIHQQDQAEFLSTNRKLASLEGLLYYRARNFAYRSSQPNPRSPLTHDRVIEIDNLLKEKEWAYNQTEKQFQATGPYGGIATLEWEDIVIGLPDLSLNEILAYQERKQQDHLREQADTRLPAESETWNQKPENSPR